MCIVRNCICTLARRIFFNELLILMQAAREKPARSISQNGPERALAGEKKTNRFYRSHKFIHRARTTKKGRVFS